MGPNAAGTMPAPTILANNVLQHDQNRHWDERAYTARQRQEDREDQGQSTCTSTTSSIKNTLRELISDHLSHSITDAHKEWWQQTYQRVILVVARLRDQRQTVGIKLQIRDWLLALILIPGRALLHMGRSRCHAVGFQRHCWMQAIEEDCLEQAKGERGIERSERKKKEKGKVLAGGDVGYKRENAGGRD